MAGQRPTARELIDLVLDDGSFESWDTPPSYGEIGERATGVRYP